VTRFEEPPDLRPVPSDPAAEAALRPLLRTGRLSRLRVTWAVCPEGCGLAEVFRSPAGLLAVAAPVVVFLGELPDPPSPFVPAPINSVDEPIRMVRGQTFDPRQYDGPALSARCKCREALVPLAWLAEQVAVGRGRAVWRSVEVNHRASQDAMRRITLGPPHSA
jgi:hypothetical protein